MGKVKLTKEDINLMPDNMVSEGGAGYWWGDIKKQAILCIDVQAKLEESEAWAAAMRQFINNYTPNFNTTWWKKEAGKVLATDAGADFLKLYKELVAGAAAMREAIQNWIDDVCDSCENPKGPKETKVIYPDECDECPALPLRNSLASNAGTDILEDARHSRNMMHLRESRKDEIAAANRAWCLAHGNKDPELTLADTFDLIAWLWGESERLRKQVSLQSNQLIDWEKRYADEQCKAIDFRDENQKLRDKVKKLEIKNQQNDEARKFLFDQHAKAQSRVKELEILDESTNNVIDKFITERSALNDQVKELEERVKSTMCMHCDLIGLSTSRFHKCQTQLAEAQDQVKELEKKTEKYITERAYWRNKHLETSHSMVVEDLQDQLAEAQERIKVMDGTLESVHRLAFAVNEYSLPGHYHMPSLGIYELVDLVIAPLDNPIKAPSVVGDKLAEAQSRVKELEQKIINCLWPGKRKTIILNQLGDTLELRWQWKIDKIKKLEERVEELEEYRAYSKTLQTQLAEAMEQIKAKEGLIRKTRIAWNNFKNADGTWQEVRERFGLLKIRLEALAPPGKLIKAPNVVKGMKFNLYYKTPPEKSAPCSSGPPSVCGDWVNGYCADTGRSCDAPPKKEVK